MGLQPCGSLASEQIFGEKPPTVGNRTTETGQSRVDWVQVGPGGQSSADAFRRRLQGVPPCTKFSMVRHGLYYRSTTRTTDDLTSTTATPTILFSRQGWAC
jgi:hypothetical protein